MKKKALKVLAMALTMTAGMLTACGDPGGSGSSDKAEGNSQSRSESSVEESSESSQQTQESGGNGAAGETENSKWYRYQPYADADEQEVVDAINAYIEPLIGVTVTVINAGQMEELDLALASGEDIDIFWAASWKNGFIYVKNNSAMDLTDLIPNYPVLQESIPENIWEGAKLNGRNYYVPIYKESATGYGMVYPLEVAERYGWDMDSVKTMADLTPLLQDAYEGGATRAYCGSGLEFANSHVDDYSFIEYRYCVKADGSDSTVMNMADLPEYAEFLKLRREWNQAGYINGDYIEGYTTGADLIQLTANGDAVFSAWAIVPDGEGIASARFGIPCGIVELTGSYINTNSPFGSAYMINVNTQKADACLKFLELLSTDETLANLAVYGIEGKHYNLTEDGRVQTVENSGFGYSTWSSCSVLAPTLQVGEAENKKELYDEFNKEAQVAVHSGFYFDNTNVESEMAAIDAVYDEYQDLLEFGFYDPEVYLPKFQEALKTAGVDKVIAEIQSQYDAWLQVK